MKLPTLEVVTAHFLMKSSWNHVRLFIHFHTNQTVQIHTKSLKKKYLCFLIIRGWNHACQINTYIKILLRTIH